MLPCIPLESLTRDRLCVCVWTGLSVAAGTTKKKAAAAKKPSIKKQIKQAVQDVVEVLTPKKTTTGRKRARVEEKTVSFEEPVTPTPVDMATPAPAVPALDVAALSQEVATAVGALVAGHLEEVANLVKASNAAVHDAVEECVGGNKTREALEAQKTEMDQAHQHTLQQKVQELEKKHRDKMALAHEVLTDDLRRQYDRDREEAMEGMKRTLEAQAAASMENALTAKHAELEASLGTARQEHEREVAAIRAKAEETLAEVRAAMESQHAEMAQAKAAAERAGEEAKSAAEATFAAKMEEVRAEAASQRDEALSRQARELQAKIEEAEAKAAAGGGELVALQNQLAQAAQEREALVSAKAKAESDLQAASGQLKDSLARSTELEHKLQGEAATASDLARRHEEQARALQQAVQEREATLASLRQELGTARSQVAKLEEEKAVRENAAVAAAAAMADKTPEQEISPAPT